MADAKRTARIHARLRSREKELLEKAARLRGVYMSELVRDAALREARRELVREDSEEAGDDG